MASITDLPQSVLDLVFGHLNEESIRSARLAMRAWSQIYKRSCCNTLWLDFSSDALPDTFALLERWQRLDLLGHVRNITLRDSHERHRDGRDLLLELLNRWLPKLSGVGNVSWEVCRTVELDDACWISSLPPKVRLHLSVNSGTPFTIAADVLSAVQRCDSLRSLSIQCRKEDQAALGTLLKDTLLGCKNITSLSVNVVDGPNKSQPVFGFARDTNVDSNLVWTAEEAAKTPALQHLDLHYPALTGKSFELWAKHGNWTSLRSLTANHGWVLEHLAGRLPILETLSVSTLRSLPAFLELQPGVLNLTVLDLQECDEPAETTADLPSMLALPFAARLQKLDLRATRSDAGLQSANIDVGVIASLCPRVRDLAITVGREQYRNAVGFFCWMDACMEAIVRMPALLRFCVVLPRLISSGTISIPPELMVIATSADLWAQLSAYGKQMQEIRVVASMALESAQSEREEAVLRFLGPTRPALTYITTPAEKDWSAEQGAYTTSCPELEHAESLLRNGRISRVSATGDYSIARRTVDDISALAHNGVVVMKKKVRPMPVWLTPEQEQDRREGPPSQGRRAKRAVLGVVNGFVGAWRPPMTETSPRTAQERAEPRETGFGGRAGWSKSSLATRVFYRR